MQPGLVGQVGTESGDTLRVRAVARKADAAAGLSVAIPAVLLVYYAHRQLQKDLQVIAQLERKNLEGH